MLDLAAQEGGRQGGERGEVAGIGQLRARLVQDLDVLAYRIELEFEKALPALLHQGQHAQARLAIGGEQCEWDVGLVCHGVSPGCAR